MHIEGHDIDPGFFNPALPTADLGLLVDASIDASRNISGSVVLDNAGPAGSIDQQRLPLRAMRGNLAGSLSQLDISDVLVDFGGAGKFTGSGVVARTKADTGLGTAEFVLHTDRLDLKGFHGKLNTTHIAGDIKVANAGDTQMLIANLSDAGLRLDARASLDNNLLTIEQARLAAGQRRRRRQGPASLLDKQAVQGGRQSPAVSTRPRSATSRRPTSMPRSTQPASSLPQWQVGANFALRPSRLFDQPLVRQGQAGCRRPPRAATSTPAWRWARTRSTCKGSFGEPGETAGLARRRPPAVARPGPTCTAPSGQRRRQRHAWPRRARSFTVDANGLGWVAAARKIDNGSLHASGEAALAPAAKDGKRSVELKASGTARNSTRPPSARPWPAASTAISPPTAARGAGTARQSRPVKLQRLHAVERAPVGHAKADGRQAPRRQRRRRPAPGRERGGRQGQLRRARDTLDWRIDAPHAGRARVPATAAPCAASGSLAGTMQAPSLKLALDGQNLRLMGKHR